jgi:hypothetical protein
MNFLFGRRSGPAALKYSFIAPDLRNRKQSSKMPSGMLPVVNTPPTTLRISLEVLGERERERWVGTLHEPRPCEPYTNTSLE